MNEPLRLGEDVALFIDWENFKISLAVGRRHPNVSALKEEVSNHGRVVVAKAYADWVTRAPELRGASQFINDPPALYLAGIDPVYVPTRLAASNTPNGEPGRTIRVKNSVDVKMTADCIECAHSYPNIRTFVLVSGDSDFIHVINALRTMGKRVIIIGVSWATSRRLSDQVDELILYDVDVDTVTPPEPVRAENGRAEPQPRLPAPVIPAAPARIELPQIISAIEEIVRDERKAGGTPLLTSIKQRLMRRFPEFDEKKVGFSGFKKLMSRVAQEGQIRLITAGLVDWAIMADEPEPDEAHTGSSRAVATAAARGKGRPGARGRPTTGAAQAAAGEETSESTGETPSETQAVEPDYRVNDDLELTPTNLEESADTLETAVGPVFDEPHLQPVNETDPIPGYAGPEPTPAPAEQPSVDLDALLADAMANLELPPGPDDGQNGRRLADLIVMAATLEERGDVSHVALNFLISEVCQALDEGLKAEYAEITNRWGKAYSKSFVTKMVRGLGNGELFVKGWYNVPADDGGRPRRLRTFYLNREHPLVLGVLKSRWESQDSPDLTAEEPESVPVAPEDVLPVGDEVMDTTEAPEASAEEAVLTSFSPADA